MGVIVFFIVILYFKFFLKKINLLIYVFYEIKIIVNGDSIVNWENLDM